MTVLNHNLFAALRSAFPEDLDAVAVETVDADAPRLQYSWRDLEQASAMLANLLDALDLPPASRIAVQVEKSVEAMVLYLATLRAGHVYVPLDTAYQSAEIEHIVGNAKPAVVVCSPAIFGWISKIGFLARARHVFTLGEDRSGSLLQRAAHMTDQHTPAVCSAHDVAAILYTSGTTHCSKGVMLSHGNLLSNAQEMREYGGWRSGDVLLHALPVLHVQGLFIGIHAALLNGSKMLWVSRFDPQIVIAEFPAANVFVGVPTLYEQMLAEPKLSPAQASNMRFFISGSDPRLVETIQEWQTRTGHTILECHGISEMVVLTSSQQTNEFGG